MAGIIRTFQRAHRWNWNWSCPSSSLVVRTPRDGLPAAFVLGTRSYGADGIAKSPFESNILRILRNVIKYQYDYPPQQPVTEFNSFTVEARPGEQVVTMRRKFGDMENIKINATMFNGFERVHVSEGDDSGDYVRPHVSLIVDISKGDGGDELEFLCSAWPDCVEIHKVYILRRGQMLRLYLGPDFRNLNAKVQEKFREYLDARGVNDELSYFLHDFIMNKDRLELILWMDSVKSFVEK